MFRSDFKIFHMLSQAEITILLDFSFHPCKKCVLVCLPGSTSLRNMLINLQEITFLFIFLFLCQNFNAHEKNFFSSLSDENMKLIALLYSE